MSPLIYFFNNVVCQQFRLFVLFISLMMINAGSIAVSNRVVAVVNDDVVTENELLVRLERIRTNPSKAEAARYKSFDSEDELRYQVLKTLVEETVLVQRAKRFNIKAEQSEIDSTVNSLTQAMGIDTSLESNKLTLSSLRKEVESEILISRLVRATLTRNINVSQFEIDEVLNTQEDARVDKEFEILQLFVKVTGKESESEKQVFQAKLSAWREELVNGVSMADLIEANASSDIVPESRNLGWKSPKQLPDLFLEQLETMVQGDISEVIASPNAFHLLQLVNLKGGARMVEKRSAQHILINAKTELELQQASERLTSIRDAVLAGGDFSEFATSLSDDSGSAAKGGDLGLMGPGETVPEFNEVLYNLKIGEVSQPVTTTFGVHLIKLNKIEEKDVSTEEQRNRIAEQIRRRKTGQQYSAWLSDIMSRAYVDYF